MPPTQWPQTVQWLAGAAGVLAITFLILNTIISVRKVFGRKPPMDEQLSSIEKTVRREFQSADAALQKQLDSLAEQRAEDTAHFSRAVSDIYVKVDSVKDEIMADGMRRTETTNTEIKRLATAIGRLDERTNPGSAIGI